MMMKNPYFRDREYSSKKGGGGGRMKCNHSYM